MRVSVVSAADAAAASDVSYAIVVSTISRNMMKRSSNTMCNVDGTYPIPIKSNIRDGPFVAPSAAWVHKLPMLNTKTMKNQNRSVRFESISLGLENWNWDEHREMRTNREGERKNESVCNLYNRVSSDVITCRR